MKRTTILCMAILALAISCKKGPSGDEVEKGMTFVASTSDAVKSHFGEGDTNLNLVWDEYDNLAVYSLKADDDDPAASAVSSIAYIQDAGVGQQTAEFRSSKPGSEWFAYPQANGKKTFIAYYPAFGIPYDFEEVGGEKVLPLILRSSQRGISDYGKHHIMISRGNEYASGDQVVFQGFTPLTSLLKFRLKMDSGYDYSVSRVEIRPNLYGKAYESSTEDTYNEYVYVYDPVSGDQISMYPEFISGGRYVKLSELLSGDEVVIRAYYDGTSWSSSSDGRYVSLLDSDDGTYHLSATEGNDLYAVVFPTIKYPSRWEFALRVSARYDIRIDNYYSHSVEHTAYIRIPSPGFVAGKRYDFVLELTPSEMYVQQDPETPEWGYDIVNWNE